MKPLALVWHHRWTRRGRQYGYRVLWTLSRLCNYLWPMMPRSCDRCTIYIRISFCAFNHRLRNRLSPNMLWKASCIEKFLHTIYFFEHYDALYLDNASFSYFLERNAPREIGSSLKYAIVLHSPVGHDYSKSFWRFLNRHHAVGHRQVFPHRVPRVFRLLQPDVLDHLSSHQRRSCGRSRAARRGQINDYVAALQIEKREE